MKKSFIADKKYLSLPVKTGADKKTIRIYIDGIQIDEGTVEFSSAPDFFMALDMIPYNGKTVDVEIDGEEQSSADKIILSDEIRGGEELYRERWRPQFHFTARRGWLNDPNGLVFHEGVYHLFFQCNPFGRSWGNMHWGHAVSTDLFHWEEKPLAIFPDAHGHAFSGSGVVDHLNSSGLGKDGNPPLVFLYTAAGSQLKPVRPDVQCLSYSNDGGETFSLYEGNPVLPHILGGNRDPKLIWHKESNGWIMALYLDKEADNRQIYILLRSNDLIHWTKICEIRTPGGGECPDFFPLAVDGDSSNIKWIFWTADGFYLIGSFDGYLFKPEGEPLRSYVGGHSVGNARGYAAQTFSDIPESDGRRIQISWLTGEMPKDMPFNSAMSLPVELSLKTNDSGIRLFSMPAMEIVTVRCKYHEWKEINLSSIPFKLEGQSGGLYDLSIEIIPDGDACTVIKIGGSVEISYDSGKNVFSCRGMDVKLPNQNTTFTVRLVIDRTSLEIFVNGGEAHMPLTEIWKDLEPEIEISTRSGKAQIFSIELFELESIW